MSDYSFLSLKFLAQKTSFYTTNPKTLFYHLRKGKGSRFGQRLEHSDGTHWRRNTKKIEQITRKIQKAKEEGLRVNMDSTIYKAATVTLDEDLASQMKRNKDVQIETEDLREELDML